MREIFVRETASSPEPFTGERLTGSVHGQVELEHYHRYLFARGFCRDKDVLDVACGEGYGAAQLAQVARRVVAMELSKETARNAATNFTRPNLHFVQCDARSLAVADTSIDIITSFETIEHFAEQEKFVAEAARVLRPEGCFIVSTPDRDIYSPPGSVPNPYHVKEFDRAEFLDLLHRHFRFVSLVRQRPVEASALIPEEQASVAPQIFERAGDRNFVLETSLPGAPFLVAIATNHAPGVAPFSLLIEHSDLDNTRLGELEAELQDALIEVEKLRKEHQAELAARTAAEAERTAAEAARTAAESARTAAESALRESQTAEAAALLQVEAERRAKREVAEGARTALENAKRASEDFKSTSARFEGEANAVAASLNQTRAVLDDTNAELDRISGSARQFFRQYLPRLWRYLLRKGG